MRYEPVQTSPFPIRAKLKIRVWRAIQSTVFRWSPEICRGFRRSLLRWFGASIAATASVSSRARIDCPWNLSMGDRASVGEDSWVYALARISIGDCACVGQRAQLLTGSHDIGDPHFRLLTSPVQIGNGAWIASSAIVLPGVTVGEMAVVAAGAVVTKSVEPWTVVGGNPAKVIGKREMRSSGADTLMSSSSR